MPIIRQQKVFYKTFSQHGSGSAMVEVEPKDVVLLIHIAYLDIFEREPAWFSAPFCELAKENFYTIISPYIPGYKGSLSKILT